MTRQLKISIPFSEFSTPLPRYTNGHRIDCSYTSFERDGVEYVDGIYWFVSMPSVTFYFCKLSDAVRFCNSYSTRHTPLFWDKLLRRFPFYNVHSIHDCDLFKFAL